jgi:DNA-binding NarL/FixJ family response regulator
LPALLVEESTPARDGRGLGASRGTQLGQDVGDVDGHRLGADEQPGGDLPVAPTGREQEILGLVAEGRSNGEIARRLFISSKTVSVHVSNILAKLGAAGRTEAVALARRRGLLTDQQS